MKEKNGLLAEAIAFAAERHKGQVRKGTNTPYITHPAEAMAIASTMTDDREVLAAAVLHDVIEDAGVTYDELKKRFGTRVAGLVRAESEEKEADAKGTWHKHKQAAISRLNVASMEEKLLVLSDKLSNIRALYRDEQRIGGKLWELFNNNKKYDHAWYYCSIRGKLWEVKNHTLYRDEAGGLSENRKTPEDAPAFSGMPAYEEFDGLVSKLFKDEIAEALRRHIQALHKPGCSCDDTEKKYALMDLGNPYRVAYYGGIIEGTPYWLATEDCAKAILYPDEPAAQLAADDLGKDRENVYSPTRFTICRECGAVYSSYEYQWSVEQE